jgi:Tol biopolymer transport system component
MSAMTSRALVTIGGLAAAVVVAGCGGSSGSTSSSGSVATTPAAVAVQKGRVAFRRFFDANHQRGAIFTIGLDGRGERQVTHPTNAVDSLDGPPSFMPDGSALIFDRTDTDGNGSLWRVNADGTHEQRLQTISGFPGDSSPVLSHDGTRIAVARAYGPHAHGGLKTALYVLHADGSAPRLVAPFGYRDDVRNATWAPDGSRIVFDVIRNDSTGNANGAALYSVAPDGSALRRLTPWDTTHTFANATFSPDGRRLIYKLTPAGQDFGGNFYIAGADASSPRQLTHFSSGSTAGSASWSPDGRSLVYATTGKGLADDVFVMRSDGSGSRPVTRTSSWESAATWVPGG